MLVYVLLTVAAVLLVIVALTWLLRTARPTIHLPTTEELQRASRILQHSDQPDGGLALPERYPQITRAQLDAWRGLSYADLAFEIISLFATDIPAADLKTLGPFVDYLCAALELEF